MITKKCLKCGEDFNVPKCREEKAQYCSNKCRYEHKTGRTLRDCKCEFCGKEFTVERRMKGKYCSEKCFHDSRRRRIEKECLQCGKIFIIKRTTTMNCCSMKCRLEYQEIHRVDKNYYSTNEWRKTRMRALVRDDFKCVTCGDESLELHVHHILPISKGGDDTLDNLSTLCLKCHREVHNHKIVTKSKG